MRHAFAWLIFGAMFLGAGAAAAAQNDLNSLLHGDYAFTGAASCLVAIDGFTSDLRPATDSRFVISFSVQGVRTFNGDGTGTLSGRSVAITDSDRPTILGAADSSDFQASFTYVVTSPRAFTTALNGPLTGTVLTGPRATQTFTIDQIPLNGMISEDKKSLTLATNEPTVETQMFSNGDVHPRICHRSRALFRLHPAN